MISGSAGILPVLNGYNKNYLSGFSNRGSMLKKFTGCLLGAAIGDALATASSGADATSGATPTPIP